MFSLDDEMLPLTPLQTKRGNQLSLSLRKSKRNPVGKECPKIISDLSNDSIKHEQLSQRPIPPEPPASIMVEIPQSVIKGLRIKSIDELNEETTSDLVSNNGAQPMIKSEIIDISSDEDAFQDQKPTVNGTGRKPCKATPSTPKRKPRKTASRTEGKIEKITTTRKLTKSTNLKTFSWKHMPSSQKSIHKYFEATTKTESVGYFETFENSTVKKSPPRKQLQPVNLNSKFVESNCSEKMSAESAISLIDDETRENMPQLLEFLDTCSREMASRSNSLKDFDISKKSVERSVSIAPSSSRRSVLPRNNNLNQSTVKRGNTLTTNANKILLSASTCSSDNPPPPEIGSTESSEIRPPNGRFRRRILFASSQGTSSNEPRNENDIIVDLSNFEAPEKNTLRKDGAAGAASARKRSKTGKTTPIKKTRRKKAECPSYKVVENTTFAVDAFRYGDIEGVTHYFLSHFHADHYIGLSKKFMKPVYLSAISARLVTKFLRTSPEYLYIIEIDKPIIIDGIEVIAMDANHCPGALMFIFKFETGLCTLHTGDFRASPEMEEGPTLWDHHIHTIYLDTTYLSSKYEFKSQSDSIFEVKCAIEEFQTKHIGEKILYIFGSYVIGKERMWATIADEYGFKVWTDDNRRMALDAIGNVDHLKFLVDDPHTADMHILSIGNVSYDYLREYLKQFCEFNLIFAIRASGWEKNSKPQYRGQINIVGIEYSEHSSYNELRRFVRFVQPSKIISTVPTGSDLSKTGKIPSSWYNNELRSWQKGYQRSITNFVRVSDSRKNLPSSTSRVINEIDNAKPYDSGDEFSIQDATLTPQTSCKRPKHLDKIINDWLP